MRKLFVTTLALLGFIGAHASHVAGGYLTYKHHTANQYIVQLYVIYDNNGIPASGVSESICVIDECSNTQTTYSIFEKALNGNPAPSGGIYIPGADRCVDDTTAIAQYYALYFTDTIALTGNCDSISIWWSSACCRPNDIENIADLGTNITLTATLDRSIGPNSMTSYNIFELLRPVCAGTPVLYDPFINEADGDSLHFSLIPVRDGSCGTTIDNTFNPGYSAQQPLFNNQTYSLHPNKGVIRFNANVAEHISTGILIEEFRYDPLTDSTYRVGTSVLDFVTQVEDSCSSEALNWGLKQDTLPIACGDQNILLTFEKSVDNSTVEMNGTDFRIIGPNLTPVPVTQVGINPNSAYSDSILLNFFMPIQDSGIYTVYVKTGNDGNSLSNICGAPITKDTIYLKTVVCNIGIDESSYSGFTLFPNPAAQELNIRNIFGGSKIEITDLQGKVFQVPVIYEVLNYLSLNVGHLPSGLYLIRVNEPGGRSGVQKFLKN